MACIPRIEKFSRALSFVYRYKQNIQGLQMNFILVTVAELFEITLLLLLSYTFFLGVYTSVFSCFLLPVAREMLLSQEEVLRGIFQFLCSITSYHQRHLANGRKLL